MSCATSALNGFCRDNFNYQSPILQKSENSKSSQNTLKKNCTFKVGGRLLDLEYYRIECNASVLPLMQHDCIKCSYTENPSNCPCLIPMNILGQKT